MRLSPPARQRWQRFHANRRAFWSLWLFVGLFAIALFAEFIANDKPIVVSYKGEILFPVLVDYPEEKFLPDVDRVLEAVDRSLFF